MRVRELKKQVFKTENNQNLIWSDGEGWTFPGNLKDFVDLTSAESWGWQPNGSAMFGQGELTYTQIEPFDGTGALATFTGGDFGERMNPYGFGVFATIGGFSYGWSDSTGSKQTVTDRAIGFGNGILDTFQLYVGTASIVPDSLVIKHTLTTVKTGTSAAGVITGANIASGTVDEITGEVNVVFTLAPDAGTAITVSYVVDSYLDVEESEVLATGNGTKTIFTLIQTSYRNVRNHSVRISTKCGGNAILLVDNGAGDLVELDGFAAMTSGTFNPVTGSVDITFATAPDDGEQLSITYCRKGLNQSSINYTTGGSIDLRFDVGMEPDNATKVVLTGGTYAVHAAAGGGISTGILAIGLTGFKTGFRSCRSFRDVGSEDYNEELATLMTTPGSRHTLSFYGRVTSTTGKCYIRAWSGEAANTQISFGATDLEWAPLTGAITRVADPLGGTKFCLQCDITTTLTRFGAYVLVPTGAYCISMEWEGDITNTYLGEQSLWVSGVQWGSGTELAAYSPNSAVFAALLPSADPLGKPGYVLSTDGKGQTAWLDPATAAASGIAQINGLNAAAQSLVMNSAGTAPAVTSSGSTHTISIPQAATAGVTAGTISKVDYDAFKAASTGTAGADYIPSVDNTYDLGSSSKRWAEIHATKAFINTIGDTTNTVMTGGATQIARYLDGLGGFTLGYNSYDSNITGAVRSDSNKAGWLMKADSNSFTLTLTKETTATNAAGDTAVSMTKAGVTTIGRTGSAWAANRLTDIGITLTHPILSDYDKNLTNPGYDPVTGPLLTVRGVTTGTGKGSAIAFARAESGTLPIAAISAVTAAAGSGLAKISFMGSSNDTTWPSEIANLSATGTLTLKSLSIDGAPLTKAMVTQPGALPSTNDGKQYLAKNGAWTELAGGGGGISHATSNGKMYGSKNGAWVEVTKSEIGLSNVDNTADSNKSVAAADYATTASQAGLLLNNPKINGVTFTGGVDITLPATPIPANTLTLPVVTGKTVTAGNVVELVEFVPPALSVTTGSYLTMCQLSTNTTLVYAKGATTNQADVHKFSTDEFGSWTITGAAGTEGNASTETENNILRLTDTTAVLTTAEGNIHLIDASSNTPVLSNVGGTTNITTIPGTGVSGPIQNILLTDGQAVAITGASNYAFTTFDYGNSNYAAKNIPWADISATTGLTSARGSLMQGNVFLVAYFDTTDSYKLKARAINLGATVWDAAAIGAEVTLDTTVGNNSSFSISVVRMSDTYAEVVYAPGPGGYAIRSVAVTLAGITLYPGAARLATNKNGTDWYIDVNSVKTAPIDATTFLLAVHGLKSSERKSYLTAISTATGACVELGAGLYTTDYYGSIAIGPEYIATPIFINSTVALMGGAMPTAAALQISRATIDGANISYEGPGAFVGGPFAMGNTAAIQDLTCTDVSDNHTIVSNNDLAGAAGSLQISHNRSVVFVASSTPKLVLYDTSGTYPKPIYSMDLSDTIYGGGVLCKMGVDMGVNTKPRNLLGAAYHGVLGARLAVVAYTDNALYKLDTCTIHSSGTHVLDMKCINHITNKVAIIYERLNTPNYELWVNTAYFTSPNATAGTPVKIHANPIKEDKSAAAIFAYEQVAAAGNAIASAAVFFVGSSDSTLHYSPITFYQPGGVPDEITLGTEVDSLYTDVTSVSVSQLSDTSLFLAAADTTHVVGWVVPVLATGTPTLGTFGTPFTIFTGVSRVMPAHTVDSQTAILPYASPASGNSVIYFATCSNLTKGYAPKVFTTYSTSGTAVGKWANMSAISTGRILYSVSYDAILYVGIGEVNEFGFSGKTGKPVLQGHLLGIATTSGGGSNPPVATVNAGNFTVSGVSGLTGGRPVFVNWNGVGLSTNNIGKEWLVGYAVSSSRLVVKL